MPKSRRKAAASRAKAKSGVQKDFVKKKERLGRKARPDNATNTSVKSRQIYLPQIPDEQEVHDASLKHGLSHAQLLQRVSHYNASTRMSALNGLTRALREGTLAASVHAKSDRANVVRIALAALQDDEAIVRRAAVALLAAVVNGVVTVRPFSKLLASSWLAGLSHIRKEVQEAAACAMTAMFGEGVRPVAVFGNDVYKPMLALCEMLNAPGVRNTAKRRIIILEALVALLEGEQKQGGYRRTKRVGKSSVFFWHSLKQDDDDVVNTAESASKEMRNILIMVAKKAAMIVTECLPVCEAKKDKSVIVLLLVAVKSLYMALSLSGEVDVRTMKPVVKMLNSWANDRNRHHEKGNVHVVHNYLAASAFLVDKQELAIKYLELALGEDVAMQSVGENAISVEVLVEKALDMNENEDVIAKLLSAWWMRWKQQIDENNMQFVIASAPILSRVITKLLERDEGKSPNELEWNIMSSLPVVIAKACVNNKTKCTEFVSEMLKLLGQICLLHGAELRQCLVESLISIEVVKTMNDVMLDDLVPVLYYSGIFLNSVVLRVATMFSKLAVRLLVVIEAHSEKLDENEAIYSYAFAMALVKKDDDDEATEIALRILRRFEAERDGS